MQSNLGKAAGSETVALTASMNPSHSHLAACGGDATVSTPVNGYWAKDPGGNTAQYSNSAPNAVMAADAITVSGSGQPHDNIQPYQCIRYIIALEGIFPPRN